MLCAHEQSCGGCPYRYMEETAYRQLKQERFTQILQQIKQENIKTGTPIFIADGTRRRAALTFRYQRGKLLFGFNENKSHEIAELAECPLLTPQLNKILPVLREFLREFCAVNTQEKLKNKKFRTYNIGSGDVKVTEADNGIDVLLEISEPIGLEHRLLISELAARQAEISRFSVLNGNNVPETIIEKSKPFLTMGGYQVFIPAGTFLQASAAGEKALVQLVQGYIGQTTGQIADLFCGVGTFSYPLAVNPANKICAVDSSAELLDGFQKSINRNMIPNIRIEKRNLFKYPLDTAELKVFDAVIFDPPRAGAAAQTAQLAALTPADRPQKIVAVSCNPHTFVNDANVLLEAGYKLAEITLVDQFVYSQHSELVALFEK